MNRTGDEMAGRKQDAVEALLGQAAPRPAPPPAVERQVRDAVRNEWQAVTTRRRRGRRLIGFAAAATVLLALTVTFNTLRITGVAPVEVATIDKEYGSIHLLGEHSELQELSDLATIVEGQTIVTGEGAGMGLAWAAGGGSLRIDENTQIEFTTPNSVYLRSGKIYFDSQPADVVTAISSGSAPTVAAISGSGDSEPAVAAISGSGVSGPDFVIVTDHGEVMHLGTQYMTEVDRGTLTVSVREGQVEVAGQHKAREGQQLRMTGLGAPSITDFSRSGGEWAWVEATSPGVDLKGVSTYDFLLWVGRQTGLKVVFATPEAESTARSGKLNGTTGDMSPREALEFWMSGELVRATIDGGAISVSSIDSGS